MRKLYQISEGVILISALHWMCFSECASLKCLSSNFATSIRSMAAIQFFLAAF